MNGGREATPSRINDVEITLHWRACIDVGARCNSNHQDLNLASGSRNPLRFSQYAWVQAMKSNLLSSIQYCEPFLTFLEICSKFPIFCGRHLFYRRSKFSLQMLVNRSGNMGETPGEKIPSRESVVQHVHHLRPPGGPEW